MSMTIPKVYMGRVYLEPIANQNTASNLTNVYINFGFPLVGEQIFPNYEENRSILEHVCSEVLICLS